MTIYSGFSHEKWWFSIVMLVYQRVSNASKMAKFARFRRIRHQNHHSDTSVLEVRSPLLTIGPSLLDVFFTTSRWSIPLLWAIHHNLLVQNCRFRQNVWMDRVHLSKYWVHGPNLWCWINSIDFNRENDCLNQSMKIVFRINLLTQPFS